MQVMIKTVMCSLWQAVATYYLYFIFDIEEYSVLLDRQETISRMPKAHKMCYIKIVSKQVACET